jgi:hypothetical protein
MYIATPINGIQSDMGIKGKLTIAYKRIETLKQVLSDDPDFEDYEFSSTFDIHHGEMPSEAEAMGDCITEVMSCDAIYLDHGWLQSKGCNLEYRAAKIYGLEIFEHDKL